MVDLVGRAWFISASAWWRRRPNVDVRPCPVAPDRWRWQDCHGRRCSHVLDKRAKTTDTTWFPRTSVITSLDEPERVTACVDAFPAAEPADALFFKPGCDMDPIRNMQEHGRGACGCAWKCEYLGRPPQRRSSCRSTQCTWASQPRRSGNRVCQSH